ncbi:Uncharacterized conserved protein YndB, AHSA1/START domain [Pseudonocardia thermophila]|jgi:Uncharacterized conserved protein|uniref:Uncharacterized conserved protein YndB, AHSA1/START domain n=1 Tax=Pseudonocardia thermophila TaxID=1848 RepID=A0A1M7B3Y5_PSETH|nr:SRPBCC domain-containing protein [Pseudonocardia thermophila]SHL49683.1 Uncharacterized conserved protein YndB, AHSA1/START domain [Pseudonocardia thermophila]
MPDEKHLTVTITVDAPPRTVYEAVLDVRGWWSAALVGESRAVGDVFEFEVPGVHWSRHRVTEIVPGERVAWRTLDARMTFLDDEAEWAGTDIEFAISERAGRTELRFTHHGVTPGSECFDACSDGWGFYIGTSLRELVTSGTGRPNGLPAEAALAEEAGR